MAKRRKSVNKRRKKTRKVRRKGKVLRARRGTKKGARRRAGARATAGPLAQLAKHRATLVAQQAELQAEIDKVTGAIELLGGRTAAAKPGRRRRARRTVAGKGLRKGSLKSYILKVMRPGQVMAVKDIAAAVRRSGYSTKSANFANQVSNALATTPGVKKVSRGKFRA
jgi:hypothetical protein